MRYLWLFLATAVGCGDNTIPVAPEIVHARDVTILAHTEDDLVFMQPDLLERTRLGGVTNIYVADGTVDADQRHVGLMAAYSKLTGSDRWVCGWFEITGHPAEHCRNADAHLSLIFLGFPQADFDGTTATSLRRLWSGEIDEIETTSFLRSTYQRSQLIHAVATLLDQTQPHSVRTLEVAGTHGRDHSDHVITGALALTAIAGSASNPELLSFRGDTIALETPNLIEPLYQRSARILGFYDACVTGCATCGEESCPIVDGLDDRAEKLRRRYAVAMRRTAGGVLRLGDSCAVTTDGGAVELGACDASERWELALDGTLRVGGAGTQRCITALATGDLFADPVCDPIGARRWFLDDEGHVWSGVPPVMTEGSALQCLVVDDNNRPRLGRCGADGAPVWTLAPTMTATARPAGLTSTGRAVRLADIDGDRRADLCAVEGGRLECAKGDGAGGFAATTTITSLAVEPESLVIGDVDGDGLLDACGRDAGGILCATAARNFSAERWTQAFARIGLADESDRSLAAVDADDNGVAEICGLAGEGVVCAGHDLAELPVVRSAWPDRSLPLWPGDLDGDRRADWCTATSDGAACGLDFQRPLTMDGVPWRFSQNGVIDMAPPNADTGALADIDADGRGDLCTLHDRAIVCARSQGHGFGPFATFATLPAGADRPAALWLGDLDGDGFADACVDDAGTIRCAPAR
ncbi:MAG TPA: VCBS repeat-containing protein [Kofleriaceae bacterium]|nr:VCBS repeat-containing protein [Kofleriaceae bacterium]